MVLIQIRQSSQNLKAIGAPHPEHAFVKTCTLPTLTGVSLDNTLSSFLDAMFWGLLLYIHLLLCPPTQVASKNITSPQNAETFGDLEEQTVGPDFQLSNISSVGAPLGSKTYDTQLGKVKFSVIGGAHMRHFEAHNTYDYCHDQFVLFVCSTLSPGSLS